MKLQIDWRLARDLLEVIGDEIRVVDKQVDMVLRRSHSGHRSEFLDLAYLKVGRNDNRTGKLLLRGYLGVATAGKSTSDRAAFWARKIANEMGLGLIDQIGLLGDVP